MSDRVVIVGAGQGGLQAAASLRQEGFAGPITLVGDEPGLPYQRPPLSKELLAGDGEASLPLRPAPKGAEVRLGAQVEALDRRGVGQRIGLGPDAVVTGVPGSRLFVASVDI